MAKKQYAWSVRGVTREARDQAKIAARNRGVTTGEWVSMALVIVADEELVVSPKSLLPIGPSPIAPSVDEAAVEKLGPRERALLALASKRPAPKGRAEQVQQAPWSIRGVSRDARLKASKVAAHRRITIGQWVNHAILVFAAREAGVEAAPKPRDQGKEPWPEVSEKTMKLVETLARHFNQTDMPGMPEATSQADQDALRDAEIIDQALLSEVATDRPPDPSPEAPAARAAPDADHTEQKISELADQVRDSDMRSEKRLADLARMMSTVADRLQSGGVPQGQDHARGGREEGPAKVSNAEMVFWESIKDSDDSDAYISYLESFPNGLFASLARRRAARGLEEAAGDKQSSSDDLLHPAQRRRPLPAGSIPKFDYDMLNERAIENTERRS